MEVKFLDLIFGQDGATQEMSEAIFKKGWTEIGDEPPTAEMMTWLFQQIQLYAKYSASKWRASADYEVGNEIYASSGTNSHLMMECTAAGTTGTVEPPWGAIGGTVTDGTAQWQICDLRDSSVAQTEGRKAVLGPDGAIPISQGGTGGTTPSQARANLGVAPLPNTTINLQVLAGVQPVAPSGGTWIWNCFVAIVTTTGLPSSALVDYGKGVVAGGSNVGFPNGGLFRIFVFEKVN